MQSKDPSVAELVFSSSLREDLHYARSALTSRARRDSPLSPGGVRSSGFALLLAPHALCCPSSGMQVDAAAGLMLDARLTAKMIEVRAT